MQLSLVIKIIFGIVFLQGLFNYLGIPPLQHQLLFEFSILLLMFALFQFLTFRTRKDFLAPGLIWFVLFTISMLVSGLINDPDAYVSFLLYRNILLPYLLFLAILNIDLSDKLIKGVNRFIIILVIIQIPAAVYKYMTYGIREGTLIGTFANNAGSLSTIFPLFVISYIIAFHLIYKIHPLYLLLIPGFIFFAWGGGKRAFFFFLPGLLLITYFIYLKKVVHRKLNIPRLVLTLMLVVIISIIPIYIGVRASPKLNPENSQWGSFNSAFMISQIVGYETRGQDEATTGGRIATTQNAINRLVSHASTSQKMFGFGPDQLYMRDDHSASFRIRYGVTGMVFSLISVGIFGTISLFLLYLSIAKNIFRNFAYIQDSYYKSIAFGTILAAIVFCFDFLFYSRVFFIGFMPSVLFFYFSAITLKQTYDLTSNSEDNDPYR
jgi:hypothetical protein